MLTVKSIIEIIFTPMIKARGLTIKDEYFEIRLKDGWLDIRLSKEEGLPMRSIYRNEVGNKLEGLGDIIRYLNITFE